MLLSLLSSAGNGVSDQGQCCLSVVLHVQFSKYVLPFSFFPFFLHNFHLDFLANSSGEEIPSSQNGSFSSAVRVDMLRALKSVKVNHFTKKSPSLNTLKSFGSYL